MESIRERCRARWLDRIDPHIEVLPLNFGTCVNQPV
jgi:hypothetical protein